MSALVVCVSAAVLALECAPGAVGAGLPPFASTPLKVSPKPGFTEFALSKANGRPSAIALGPDGNLWFVETSHNNVGRITPGGKISQFAIPTPGGAPGGIAAGSDGNVWFTEGRGGKI